MARSHLIVRLATPGDVDAVVALVSQVRAHPESPRVDQASTRRRIRNAIDRQDVSLCLAWLGRDLVGVVVYRTGEVLPLADVPALHVETIVVHPEYRNRGIGRALLRQVLGTAESLGVEQIVANSPQTDRFAARYLARLGFEPLISVRGVRTGSLRRRLLGRDAEPMTPASGISRILATRRRQSAQRHEAATDAVLSATSVPPTLGAAPSR